MGLLFSVLTLPYTPVGGVTALGKVLLRQAQDQLYGQAAVRRQLEELDEAVAAGRISADDREREQQTILDRLNG